MTKQQTKPRRQPSILRQLADLDDLPTADLKERWRTLYGKESPRFNRQFLIKRLAYRIQEIAHGGVTDELRDRMDRVLDESGYNELGVKLGGGSAGTVDRPVAGTVLSREHGGEKHEVVVLAKGFEYRGKPYRSLSAIARAITGTRWNGLIFFGLRRPAVAKGKSDDSA